jgi:ATP-dependent RNA helicase DeaD
MSSFNDFSLQSATYKALAAMEIAEPTPIQAQAIPILLAGKDLVGQSATGSGKTLAYSIPLVERLARDKRTVQALILVPTRELAIQVNSVLSNLAAGRRLSIALLVGGRPYGSQISALRYGSQIVIGTPGRIQDHLDRGTLVLNQLRMCILDEADQMLDSGFAPVIEEILSTTPETRQMALFSATIPGWVAALQQKFLKDPVTIAIAPATGTESTIEQIAYQVPHDKKMAALCTLLNSTVGESSLIFGKTKFGVEKLGKQLSRLGFTVGTLHGNKSQRAREEVLTAFRRGQVQTLLATNVAARGLDITGISQVINYELPESSDLFTHRIGRTGRMGRQGKAITLLVPSDVPKWRRMARNLGQVVLLQHLVIDEGAGVMPAGDLPDEAPIRFPHEQNRLQQPVRDRQLQPTRERQQFSTGFERDRRERSRDGSYTASDTRRRRREYESSEPAHTPVTERESFASPERPYASKARDGRKTGGRQARIERASSNYEAYPLAITEPEQRPARKKSRMAPVSQANRTSAPRRA